MAMSGALLASVCFWSSYTTNTAPPSNAFPAGFYHLSEGFQTSPLYVVRKNETGGDPAIGWQRTQHVVEVHGVRGFTDFHLQSQVPAEILSCDGLDTVSMRWIKYHPWIEMEQCLQLGRTKEGERIYLARIYVADHPPARAYLPARFVPSSGLAITEHYGTYATDEFKLFCQIQN